MDTLKESLTDLASLFNKRMDDFADRLQKSSPQPSSVVTLTADFVDFRDFIVKTLNMLQRQVEVLGQDLDRMEMRSRRKMLLLHGVPELKEEIPAKVVSRLAVEKLKISDIRDGDIVKSHRLGASSATGKPRPLLFKLRDQTIRDKIWTSKTRLKASGITLSEFLTKPRHDTFMAARQKFGISKCWTQDGRILIIDTDGARHRITSFNELNNIECRAADPPPATKLPAAAKPRRAAASKK